MSDEHEHGRDCALCTEAMREEAGKVIEKVMAEYGFHLDDRVETVKDLYHLRKHRLSQEAISGWTKKTLITTVVLGAIAAFWLGIKTIFGIK